LRGWVVLESDVLTLLGLLAGEGFWSRENDGTKIGKEISGSRRGRRERGGGETRVGPRLIFRFEGPIKDAMTAVTTIHPYLAPPSRAPPSRLRGFAALLLSHRARGSS